MTCEQQFRWGRAYRDGRLVAARAYVTILKDPRIAPSPPVPPQLRVRFVQGIDTALRHELEDLVCSRRKRTARTSTPIRIVWDEPARGWEPASRQTHEGSLQAPPGQFALLEEVNFQLRPAESSSLAPT